MAAQPGSGRRSSDTNFANQVEAALRNRELIAFLAEWRSEHGPSQAETAKRMHTSQPAVARLESHQHDAQLSTLARYVSSLGLSLEFVLRDRETGERIWTSDEESEPMFAMKPQIITPTTLDPAGLFVFRESWQNLSERDLEHQPFVIVSSQEPGLSVLYKAAQHRTAAAVDFALHSSRAEKAEASKVIGFFVSHDSDPAVIATPSNSETRELDHIYTIEAKLSESIITDLSHQNIQASIGHLTGLIDFGPGANFASWLSEHSESPSSDEKS